MTLHGVTGVLVPLGAQQRRLCRQRRLPVGSMRWPNTAVPMPKRDEKATRRRCANGARNAIGRILARIDSGDHGEAGVTASGEPKERDTLRMLDAPGDVPR